MAAAATRHFWGMGFAHKCEVLQHSAPLSPGRPHAKGAEPALPRWRHSMGTLDSCSGAAHMRTCAELTPGGLELLS